MTSEAVTGYLVTDAVAGLIGVIGPVHLAAGLCLRQHRGLLGKFLSQSRGRGAGGKRGGRGRGRRLMVGRLDAAPEQEQEVSINIPYKL